MKGGMKMIKHISLLSLFSIFIFSFLNSKEILKLDDAIKIALENNYSIKIVKKTTEIAENNLSPGNAGMLPSLDINAGGSYEIKDTRTELQISGGGQSQGPTVIETSGSESLNINASINLNWTLFDGFAMFISYEKFEALRDKSNIELQISIEGMIRNLINSYFEALRLQQQLKILKENIDISRDRLNRMRDATEFGAALKIEVYKAEVDFNIDSSAYLQSELAYKNMLRNLNDFQLEQNVEFGDNPDYKNLLEETRMNNTSINRAIRDNKISELDYEIINSMYYPRINFQSGYSYARNESEGGFMRLSQSNGFNIGLNASWNLFNGTKTSIQSQNAKVNVMINEIQYDNIKSQLELNLSNAYDSYVRRKKILELEKREFSYGSNRNHFKTMGNHLKRTGFRFSRKARPGHRHRKGTFCRLSCPIRFFRNGDRSFRKYDFLCQAKCRMS